MQTLWQFTPFILMLLVFYGIYRYKKSRNKNKIIEVGKPVNLAWKKAAFTVCRQGRHLGKSVRTKSHRYTEWVDYADRDNENAAVRFSEMYDLESDSLEQNNLADILEHAAIQKELSVLLAGGWEGAIPQLDIRGR